MIKFIIPLFILFAIVDAMAGIPERKETSLIVIHHSDTPDGNVANFREYHMKKRGWSDIGYHYVILPDGTVENGRPEHLVGAHAKDGRRNWCSIGVCLVGEDSFTDKQIVSLKKLLADLCQKYNIKEIQRHHEQCPGLGLPLEKIAQEILG